MIDNAERVVDLLGDEGEDIEQFVFDGDLDQSQAIFLHRRRVDRLIRGIHPILPILDTLERGEPVETPQALRPFLRDVGDHARTLTEELTQLSSRLDGLLNANLARVTVRQNVIAPAGRASSPDTSRGPTSSTCRASSAPDTPLKFMMPSVEHLARAFGRHGLGDGSRVVLYSIGTMMWATRVWWMLRSLGFDGAAVLDGGFDRWQAEGRAIETGDPKGYPPATFAPQPRPGRFVDRTTVQAAIGDPRTVIVNALGPQFHQGLEPSRYGRPGRVPGSVNVPAANLINQPASASSRSPTPGPSSPPPASATSG